MVRHADDMSKRKNEPCPAEIEDACPIPRYYCKERGEPGRHCEELFADFEAMVLPDEENGDAYGEGGLTLGSDDLRNALGDVADSLGILPPDESDD